MKRASVIFAELAVSLKESLEEARSHLKASLDFCEWVGHICNRHCVNLVAMK